MPNQAPPPNSERLVRCVRLGRELPGLLAPPFPNELGKRIFSQVSLEAWRQWLEHAKILVNENALRLSDPGARDFLMRECEAFLFGGSPTAPTPPAAPVRKLVQLKRGAAPPGSGPTDPTAGGGSGR